jgi:hypothetical protein
MDTCITTYEEAVGPARRAFATSPAAQWLLSNPAPDVVSKFVHAFFVYGIQMTSGVESWLLRSGERCIELGYTELGQAIRKHAKAEAGHDQMFVRDLEKLGNSTILPPSAGVLAYCRLHEDTIVGPTPYAQIAIEYEIEQLPVLYGPALLALVGSSEFLSEHIVLDVGHTKFNYIQLEAFLTAYQESLPALIQAGTSALEAYSLFLMDCVTAATC